MFKGETASRDLLVTWLRSKPQRDALELLRHATTYDAKAIETDPPRLVVDVPRGQSVLVLTAHDSVDKGVAAMLDVDTTEYHAVTAIHDGAYSELNDICKRETGTYGGGHVRKCAESILTHAGAGAFR